MPEVSNPTTLIDGEGNLLLPGPVQQADIDATASGNTQVVAAVSGKKIRVVSVLVTNKASAKRTVKFQSSTTNITASHMVAADGGGYSRDALPGGWLFETSAGEALNINLDAGGNIGCDVSYQEV